MKLLVITQTVDKNNPVLGFMHRWIEEFSKKFEFITIICLEKGEHRLPSNVKVLSLGKEQNKGLTLNLKKGQTLGFRIKYLSRFYKYIWAERKNYDAVLVHMNQEYVLLGWKTWWFMRKPVYMWRNHPKGSILTSLAALCCKKVFCTSKYSYTAKYKKAVLMPVGVDTKVFSREYSVERKKNSILFLGRIAPIKAPHLLIDALAEMKNGKWSATIIGDALPKDRQYFEGLKTKVKNYGLDGKIIFKAGASNQDTPKIYSAHEIFVNLSPSGMYDKTIFEAMAGGCIVLTSNQNLAGEIDDKLIVSEEKLPAEIALKISTFSGLSDEEKARLRERGFILSKKHNLPNLVEKIYFNLQNS